MHPTEATKLARLWITLEEIKTGINNICIPLGAHLGIEDPDLMSSLEDLSTKTEGHFKRYKLVATARLEESSGAGQCSTENTT